MDEVIERISMRTFLRTLSGDEYAALMGVAIGYTQNDIALAFNTSPASVTRLLHSVRRKYVAWDI